MLGIIYAGKLKLRLLKGYFRQNNFNFCVAAFFLPISDKVNGGVFYLKALTLKNFKVFKKSGRKLE
jgi:hypothetical protein